MRCKKHVQWKYIFDQDHLKQKIIYIYDTIINSYLFHININIYI